MPTFLLYHDVTIRGKREGIHSDYLIWVEGEKGEKKGTRRRHFIVVEEGEEEEEESSNSHHHPLIK